MTRVAPGTAPTAAPLRVETEDGLTPQLPHAWFLDPLRSEMSKAVRPPSAATRRAQIKITVGNKTNKI